MIGENAQFIGTKVVGDEGGLDALATWLGEMESVVEAAGSRLGDLVYEAAEAWVGGAGNYQFALQLETGRQAAFELADRLNTAVSHVEACAATMAASQRQLADIEEQARSADLAVHDHRILDPYHTMYSYRQDSSTTDLPDGTQDILEERKRLFLELSEAADQAMAPVADKLEEFAKGGRWFDGLVFTAGALVAEETTIIAEHERSRLAGRAGHHGRLESYWRRPRGPGYIPGVDDNFDEFADRHGLLAELAERGSGRAGMVAKFLGGWWTTAVITGLEFAGGLAGQEREGKIIVQVGTGLAAGAAGTAAFGAMVAGASLIPGMIIVAVVAGVAWFLSDQAGSMYENFVPESPRDKLERYT